MEPTGEQLEIRHGEQRAVAVELGGGLRAYEVAGVPVLAGYDEDELTSGGRGQLLIPWPNRLHGGRYTWDGQEHTVPQDEPDKDNALHGLTRWRSWDVSEVADEAVTLTLRLLPQPAYPFALDLSVRYALGDDGLTVTTSATNVGDAAAPYGQGAHPYLSVGTELVDDAVLAVPARTWLPTDDDGVPTGRQSVDGTPWDLRAARRIGDRELDHCFTHLERGPYGQAEVVLSGPDRRVVLWLDEGYRYVQVFTGDTLPPEQRRRRGVAVEPMTCPPDAFRSGVDLLRLEPGATTTRHWGVRPS